MCRFTINVNERKMLLKMTMALWSHCIAITQTTTPSTMKVIPGLVATLHCLLQLQHMVYSLWAPIFTDPEKTYSNHCVLCDLLLQSPAGLDHAGPGHLVHEVDQLHRLVLLLLLAHTFKRARARLLLATSHRVDLKQSWKTTKIGDSLGFLLIS